ncbi:MAG: hypothetical protein KDD06_21840, partial [Phaeodactylibacter sp.]|nr:hypothetical protein [Phaeodactylibacter sp.]
EKGVPYAGHWESNSWDGLKGEYTEPHRWYFRTIGEWVSLFTSLGLAIRELREPLNPESRKPLSLLFVVG